ncbi:BAH domain-containing protein, partial [Blyttiomyces helicus]
MLTTGTASDSDDFQETVAPATRKSAVSKKGKKTQTPTPTTADAGSSAMDVDDDNNEGKADETNKDADDVSEEESEEVIAARRALKGKGKAEPAPARTPAPSKRKKPASPRSGDEREDPADAENGQKESATPYMKRRGRTLRARSEKPATSATPVVKKPKVDNSKRFYTPDEEYPFEDPEYEVFGEDLSEFEPGELPCRELTDFTIYDMGDKNKLVSLYDIELRKEPVACGYVLARLEDDDVDDDDDDDETQERPLQKITLGALATWEYEEISGGVGIWIQTPYAWYLLKKPSEQYAETHRPFEILGRAVSSIFSAIAQNAEITYDEFLASMNEVAGGGSSCRAPVAEYNFELTEADIKTRIVDIMDELEALMEKKDAWTLSASPLFQKLVEILNAKQGKKGKNSSRRRANHWSSAPRRTGATRDVNRLVLEKRNPSTVTPLVASIAKGLFNRHTVVVDRADQDADGNGIATDHATQPHRSLRAPCTLWHDGTDPDTIKWSGKALVKNKTRTHYSAVTIETVKIAPGDFIYVRHEDDNDVAAEPWFGRVEFLFEEKGEAPQAHVRWFSHGDDTILHECAAPHELFLLNDCMDVELTTVMGKCQVTYLEVGAEEPKYTNEADKFFYRFHYDVHTGTTEDVKRHDLPQPSKEHCLTSDNEWCGSCQKHMEDEAAKSVAWVKGSTGKAITLHGVTYRHLDFAYLIPETDNTPYDIVQIIGFKGTPKGKGETTAKSATGRKRVAAAEAAADSDLDSETDTDALRVVVRFFARYNDVLTERDRIDREARKDKDDKLAVPSRIPRDERRLYITDTEKNIDPALLEGTCWVAHRADIPDPMFDAYREEPDSFFFFESIEDVDLMAKNSKDRYLIKPCDKDAIEVPADRKEKREKDRQERLQKLASTKKLRALDIFSGCGGITVGMDDTGVVHTTDAVEFSASATKTF